MKKTIITVGLICLTFTNLHAGKPEADSVPKLSLDSDGPKETQIISPLAPSTQQQSPQASQPDGLPPMTEANGEYGGGQASAETATISAMYPLDRTPGFKTKTPQLQQDEYEMNIERGVANKALKQQRRYERIVSGIHDVALLQKPITKPFSAVDTIHVTAEYLTTIVFPSEYRVQYVQSGTALAVSNFDQNVYTLLPNRDFQSTSLAIGLSDGNNNTVVNIIVEKYLPGDIVKDNVEGRLLSCGEYISTMIRYINPPKIKDVDVLKHYLALYGEKSLKNFKKNGSFDVITIAGMPFYVIRDDKLGTIDYSNISFRISNRYEQFVDELRGRR
jgi:hypothetical protein